MNLEDGVYPKAARSEELLNKCVSIDLEIDPKTNRIQSFAGVRQKPIESYVFKRGNLLEALDGLDLFSDAAEFVVGHNFITFDARHLESVQVGSAHVSDHQSDRRRLHLSGG